MSIAETFGPGGAWGDGDVDTEGVADTSAEQLANSAAVSEVVADTFGPGGAYGDVGPDTEGTADTAEQQIVNLGLDPGDIQSRVGQAFGGSGDPDDPDPAGGESSFTVPYQESSPSLPSLPSTSGAVGVVVAVFVAIVGLLAVVGGD